MKPARWLSLIEARSGRLLAALLAAVLAGGLIYSFLLGDRLRYYPDEWEYLTLAENLVTQGIYSLDGEHPTAYRPPGYPLVLAFVRWLGGELLHLRLVNFVLLSASGYLAYRLLLERASKAAALLGALLVCGYPLAFYTAGAFYPQTLATFSLLAAVFLASRREGRPIHDLLAGAASGLLVLSVPLLLFAPVTLALWRWLQGENARRSGIALLIAGTLLVAGAWTLRNYAAFGSFIFIATNSGENLLMGNSENTTPNAGTNVDISEYRSQAEGLDEAARDRFFRAKALEYVRSHKLESAQLYLRKVLNYFNYRNELVTEKEESTAKDALLLLTYGPLLLLLLIRWLLVKFVKPSSFEILLVGLYVLSAFVHAVFFTRIRFRVPLDALLLAETAFFLDRILQTWLNRDRILRRPSLGRLP